ncbi:hypothetical protein ACW7EJ_04150 [Acinetobacter soli]|uniref:hypothetical protein n=1 Tax=Acinetobacter soli TaxID=487316 RepID=UPI002D808CDC|nr:hypothetical protein [Acinetobacter soli]MEB4801213.1 hypothetical protein [Acinetobacter soli]
MKNLSFIIIFLFSGYCSAYSPNSMEQVKINETKTQKKIKESGWQYTKWGMSAEEIVGASQGKARAVYGEEKKNKSNPYYFDCLAVSEFTTGPFKFEVNFRAKPNEKTLNSVYLNLVNSDQYDELKDSLVSKYGKGITTVKGNQITTSWQTDSEVIELKDLRGSIRFVGLSYTKRVYGPRGLDL